MIKYLSGFVAMLAALTLSASAPAMAQEVKAPEGVGLITVQLCDLLEQKDGLGAVVITAQGKDVLAIIGGCAARWNGGDTFYMLAVPEAVVFIVHKPLFDAIYKEAKGDFKVAVSFLMSQKQVCAVLGAKPVPKA